MATLIGGGPVSLVVRCQQLSPKQLVMDIKARKLKVGRASVVIGNVTGGVGDESVVIGPTDQYGNTILNTPMAVGRGAFAGPGSIAVGAGAGAGGEAVLPILVNQLADLIEKTGDQTIVASFNELVTELSGENGQPDRRRAASIMERLRNISALNGAWELLERIHQQITRLL